MQMENSMETARWFHANFVGPPHRTGVIWSISRSQHGRHGSLSLLSFAAHRDRMVGFELGSIRSQQRQRRCQLCQGRVWAAVQKYIRNALNHVRNMMKTTWSGNIQSDCLFVAWLWPYFDNHIRAMQIFKKQFEKEEDDEEDSNSEFRWWRR